MSRIGKKPVPVGKAKVAIAGQKINVEGPKGKLALDVHPLIKGQTGRRQPARRAPG
jgi:large subunit ribosomal protein L6